MSPPPPAAQGDRLVRSGRDSRKIAVDGGGRSRRVRERPRGCYPARNSTRGGDLSVNARGGGEGGFFKEKLEIEDLNGGGVSG